jgi:hypothetical protein
MSASKELMLANKEQPKEVKKEKDQTSVEYKRGMVTDWGHRFHTGGGAICRIQFFPLQNSICRRSFAAGSI